MCTGAVSRYKHERSQEFVKVLKFDGVHWSGVRIEQRIESSIESSTCKNRDKQMPFIVRVRCSFYFQIVSKYLISSILGFFNCLAVVMVTDQNISNFVLPSFVTSCFILDMIFSIILWKL